MCTLAFRFRPGADTHLVVAANRDERLDRPAETWALRTTVQGIPFVGPRDVTAGGTWMGINVHGLFVGITNHHVGTPPDPSRRSRGALVDQALSHRSAEDVRRALSGVAFAAYNPFHLVVADAGTCWMWHGDAAGDAWLQLHEGTHVVTETLAVDAGPRAQRVARALDVDRGDDGALHDALAVHADPPRDGPCLHLGTLYGTRSSAVIRLGRSPRMTTLSFTDGAPCTSPRLRGDDLVEKLRTSDAWR